MFMIIQIQVKVVANVELRIMSIKITHNVPSIADSAGFNRQNLIE